MFMLIRMISHCKLPEKNDNVTATGGHNLLGNDDAQSFETRRINKHSVTVPSALVFMGDDYSRSFGTPKK